MQPFPSFLFANFYHAGLQKNLDLFHKSGQLRDQSANLYLQLPPDFVINFIFAKLLANFFNLTLVTNDNSMIVNNYATKCGSLILTDFPQIISHVDTFGGLEQAINVWNCFYNASVGKPGVTERPVFFKKESPHFNFAYCSVPRRKFESSWNFRIFTVPFDVWTWVVLTILLLLVSIIVSISARQDFITTFISSLAALLDNEIRHFTNSKLYILWLFTTLLIVDFYSGEITSRVIAPPEEILLKSLSDLDKHNFKIIFPHELPLIAISESNKETGHLSGNLKENSRILKRLTKNSTVLSVMVDDTFMKTLVGEHNVATIVGYCYAIWHASNGNRYIMRNESPSTRNKRCHIGQELIQIIGERYVVLTPPGSEKLANVFEKLLASGIIQRWDQEAIWLMYARRVQDRGQVISKTMLAKEPTTFQKLRIEGKMVTIFWLWILCILISCTALMCELVGNRWCKTGSLRMARVTFIKAIMISYETVQTKILFVKRKCLCVVRHEQSTIKNRTTQRK